MNISKERLEEMQRQQKKKAALTSLMKKYDTNQSGKLETEQIKKLLTDLDSATPPGTEPTEEEMDFILKAADQEGDGCLNKSELEYAVKAWATYTSQRENMQQKMEEFDANKQGTLNKEELKAYLTSLNGGQEPTEGEVEWVWNEADILADGQIHAPELLRATALWYAYSEKQKSSCCCTVQ